MRPGEKLYEELLIGKQVLETEHQKIMRAQELVIPWTQLNITLKILSTAVVKGDYQAIRAALIKTVDGFEPQCEVEDWLK